MPAESSPTTPKAKPVEIAASSSPSPPNADTFDRMEHLKTLHPPRDLGERFSSALDFTPTKAPPLPPSCFQDDARAAPAPLPSAPSSNIRTANNHSGGGIYIAPDGSVVRSPAGFRAGTVPGNYRSRFDHSMVYRAPGSGVRSFGQQHYAPQVRSGETFAAPPPTQPAPTSAPAPIPIPASVQAHRVQAVIPPPGVRTTCRPPTTHTNGR